MTQLEIFNELGGSGMNVKSSNYALLDNGVLLRVSNHLPNEVNFQEFNEGAEKIMLVFVNSNLTESEVDSYIEKNMSNYYVSYVIVDSEDSILYAKMLINNL